MKIYKYRGGSLDFSRDILSLEKNCFWAPTRENLNDPCEGLYGKLTLDYQLKLMESIFKNKKSNNVENSFKDIKNSLKKILEFTDISGVYSLSTDPLDELLWAHYGDSHKGFCIEYDIDQLIDFTRNENYKIPVKYKNIPPQLKVSDLTGSNNTSILEKLLGTKSKKWKYEKEVRIVTSQSGEHEYDYRAVKSIYFGYRMQKEKQIEIMKRLAGRDINYYKVTIKDGYTFNKVSVKDEFINHSKYKYSVGLVNKDAIPSEPFDEKYRPHMHYLHKAAEIVRRDPYCDLIETVEFSNEKGTPKNPTIYVWYKRKENKWMKQLLTLPEIDEKYKLITDI